MLEEDKATLELRVAELMVEMEVVQKAPKVICRCDSYCSSFAKEVLTTYVVCVFVVLFIGKIQRELTKSAQSGREW